MKTITQWIENNPEVTTWITLISLIGVLGTIIALILQIKDKRKKALFYSVISTVLLNNKNPSSIKSVYEAINIGKYPH